MSHYLVVYEQGDDGAWGANSPDVEGVFAVGPTRAVVEHRMTEALEAHLAFLRAEGASVPLPRTEAGFVGIG